MAIAVAFANMGCKKVPAVGSPEGVTSTASTPTFAVGAPATDGVPKNRNGRHVTESGVQSTHESSKEDLPPRRTANPLERPVALYKYLVVFELGSRVCLHDYLCLD